MKKTLIALAALAVVSAASAQSTVTIYGVVDMGIASLKDSNSLGQVGVDSTKVGIQQGSLTNSRIGFKGTEDLGGGLKANFVYELQTNPDEATQSLTARVGTVGLSGGFGAVTIGRQYTPYHTVQAAVDLAGNLNATPGYVVNAHNFNGGRASNAISYASPSIAGFSGIAQVGAGPTAAGTETVTGATTAASFAIDPKTGVLVNTPASTPTQADGKSYGLAGIYAAGPLVAAVAYNSLTNPSAQVSGLAPITGGANLAGFGTNSLEVKVWAAGASYDFGVVKAALAYSSLIDSKNTARAGAAATDLTSKGYNLSVAAPFGATTLIANVGRADLQQDNNGVGTKTDGTITGYQLNANYSLSKRTTAYAIYGSDTTTLAGVSGEFKRTSTAVGIRHSF